MRNNSQRNLGSSQDCNLDGHDDGAIIWFDNATFIIRSFKSPPSAKPIFRVLNSKNVDEFISPKQANPYRRSNLGSSQVF
jgi:hypothetical protein